MFADSDDYLPPNALEILLRLIEESGADIAYGGFYLDRDGEISEKKFRATRKRYSYTETVRAYLNLRVLYGYVWGKLYRRSILEGVEDPIDMSNGEDGVFSYRALVNAKRGVAFTPEPVYYYRMRTDSLSGHGQPFREQDLDYLKQAEYVAQCTDMAMRRFDFMTFCFVSHFGALEKYLASDENSKRAFRNEYQAMSEYCRKTWKAVLFHSINPRIKLMALKYGLFCKQGET